MVAGADYLTFMDDDPSERVIEQRVRNRIAEVLSCLADPESVLAVGTPEYFESFFDWFPYRPGQPGVMHPNSTIDDRERTAILQVLALMNEASDSTPRNMTAGQFLTTRWPVLITPAAARALAVIKERGRFSEELEEDEPSETFRF